MKFKEEHYHCSQINWAAPLLPLAPVYTVDSEMRELGEAGKGASWLVPLAKNIQNSFFPTFRDVWCITVTHMYLSEAFPISSSISLKISESVSFHGFPPLCTLGSGKCQSTSNFSEGNAFPLSVGFWELIFVCCPNLQSSCLRLQSHWDYRLVPPHPS